MESQSTTDLEVVKKYPDRFTWGKVVEIHTVGRYDIVQYELRDGLREAPGTPHFHVYVDGKNLSRSCGTLEAALIFAISKASLNDINLASHMASAALKLLDVPG